MVSLFIVHERNETAITVLQNCVPVLFVIVYGMNIRCTVILLCISFKSNEISTGTAVDAGIMVISQLYCIPDENNLN